jgi:hypothetical protein
VLDCFLLAFAKLGSQIRGAGTKQFERAVWTVNHSIDDDAIVRAEQYGIWVMQFLPNYNILRYAESAAGSAALSKIVRQFAQFHMARR